MTTASVYYSNRTAQPDYILIGGDRADVDMGPQMGKDLWTGNRDAVDAACRTLGWKAAPNAPIVRQADGRGTIRILPVDDATPIAAPRAYITQFDSGTLKRVAVDGQTAVLAPGISALDIGEEFAEQNITTALLSLGYRRTGPIVDDGKDSARLPRWSCPVEPVDATTGPADWRDHPTMVRINNDAANVLALTADRLGIPADTLASAWILRAAIDAQQRQARFRGVIENPSRIVRWLPDGSPELKD